MLAEVVSWICLIWYIFILGVCSIGVYRIRKANTPRRSKGYEVVRDEEPRSSLPNLTIIRPVKGLEPYLYECLASSFHQTYPEQNLTVCFCVSDRDDPAVPTLERLASDFERLDTRIYIEDEDAVRSNQEGPDAALGPNPKIRNMSRAYKKASGDLIWIVDCNVWIGPQVAQDMVNLLCGLDANRQPVNKKYKFAHQLPLSVDISETNDQSSLKERIMDSGGLLEEMFLSTSHAKFYTAINTVAIAPCIVGKSNMFRRSHLDALTSGPTHINPEAHPRRGIDHFSSYICEDHLIGDLLWKSPVPDSVTKIAQRECVLPGDPTPKIEWGNHAMLPPTSPQNLAIQPMIGYPLQTYIDRRTRWLRVRKLTVLAATFVEPGTESFLCSAYVAFAISTLPWFHETMGIPPTWTTSVIVWLLSVAGWSCIDRWVWRMLHHSHNGNSSNQMTGSATPFLGIDQQAQLPRPWRQWILAWLGREALAFPIWAWAIFGGMTAVWRDRKFAVGFDMRVREIEGDSDGVVGGSFSDVDRGLGRQGIRSSSRGDTGSGGESGRKRRRD